MKIVNNFSEYEILDMQGGSKLERWNNIVLERPDPQIIWQSKNLTTWNPDAKYTRSNTGGGSWTINKNIPASWIINYKDLKFNLKLMGFKHTGLFPEQACNWDLIRETITNSKKPLKVLNLFAYTGAASVAALSAGASVVHVDSSRGMVDWAKENVKLNNLENADIRFIVDDVKKFVKREIRRGHKYDIIIMDPPSFGRGSKNEVWNIERDLDQLLKDINLLLSEDAKLLLINIYTSGLSKIIIENLLYLNITKKGKISSDDLGLPVKNSNLILPCGSTTRWESL